MQPIARMTLIWPLPPAYRSWRRFWWHYPELLDTARSLKRDFPIATGLCARLADYVGDGLHCRDRFGSVVPVLHRAIATGLRLYAADLDCSRSGQCLCGSRAYATFVDPTLRAIAIMLSKIVITADDQIWQPAAGLPLTPWLLARGDVAPKVHHRASSRRHRERVKQALEAYVLTPDDLRALGRAPSIDTGVPASRSTEIMVASDLSLEDAESQRDRLYRRLTAYVHGELDAAEARAVEILMQRDEAVSHVVHGLVQLDEGLGEVLRWLDHLPLQPGPLGGTDAHGIILLPNDDGSS